ncbi:DUF3515 domain-containing protein [Streptomyces triticagri]|uniref:DUF3515 domain-containing protein n=1 Tax=Streptomyces triticagri TaxID=2293568 RepID=A0A372M949_9ACTN|nr:DUF3515 domain-containing protein [Streptomyces triticagri]RFU87401.1 DUF3515 domain-containing protein [Streptomyces triticagri]
MNFFRHRLACLPVLGLLCATAGCSSTDDTASAAVPTPASSVTKLCRSLDGQLPQRVSGLDREDPEPRSALTAGWGDSAIILRCGVERPSRMADPEADGVEVDGVGWLLEQQDDGSFTFTTTLRKAYVEITLDKKRAEDGGLGPLTEFAAPVRKTVPKGIAG